MLAACILVLLVGAPRVAGASPQEVIGFGQRSIAMGRSGVAIASGVDSIYANPALLSQDRSLSLQVGIVGALFDLRAGGDSGSRRIDYSALKGTTVGAMLPLPFGGVLKDRITIGLGFVTPLDVVVRGRILYPEKPQFLIADRVQSVALEAGIGVDVSHGVRLGVGFAALAALDGSVLVQTDATGRIGTLVQDTLVASYAPRAGISYEFSRGRYRVGLAFRGKLVGRFNVVIRADNLGSLNVPPLNISGVAQYDPWQIAIEAARIRGPWRAAIGATYKHWPEYPGPVEATVRCEDAPDPSASCEALVPAPVEYRPVVAPHVGVERALPIGNGSELALRAGYAFEPSPAPEQKGSRNYFDNHRSVLSAGWGIRLGSAPLAFDGFVQLQILHARDHHKTPEEGAPVAQTIATSGTIVAAGVAATARF
jgi:long-chain fatty acid transport protein